MTQYSELRFQLSNAAHIYGNVTQEERDVLTQDAWCVQHDGVTYVGTMAPEAALTAKEIQPSAGELEAIAEAEAAAEAQAVLAQEAQLVKFYTEKIDELMQSKADLRHYDTIITAAMRAGYPGPYHEEGVAYATWMDNCWYRGYQIIAEVKAGLRALPSVEELYALLPELVLPAPVVPVV